MGLRLSKVECNVPTRMLIGHQNSKIILENCAIHRIAYLWGFLLVVEVIIAIGMYSTRNNASTSFKVPAWLLTLPIIFGVLYALTTRGSSEMELATETLEQELSGMSKKEYYNYKIGDDRATKSLLGSATSATILASSNVLGPFLRGDR